MRQTAQHPVVPAALLQGFEFIVELKALLADVGFKDLDQAGDQGGVGRVGFEQPRLHDAGLDLEHQQFSREH